MTRDYRLVSYALRNGGKPRAGIVVGDKVYDARGVLGVAGASVLAILQGWDRAQIKLAAFVPKPSEGVALAAVILHAPLLYPGTLFCAGANYWDHLNEMAAFIKETTGKEPPVTKLPEPWFFIKTSAASVVGTGANIARPSFTQKLDWEAELAVVIGRKARNLTESTAMDAVAGYMVMNDLSARDHVKREGSPFIYDWVGQKCFAGAAPMGPWLTPASAVADPMNLDIRLSVNGVQKQRSNTGQMVHSIAEQVAYLSRHIELQPGDVIATGTPAGVGMPRGDFLKPGDAVTVEIVGLGTLVNRIVGGDANG